MIYKFIYGIQEITQARNVLYAIRKTVFNSFSRAKLETEVKRRPKAYMTEGQIKAIQAKEWLTLKEAAFLLNISPLALRRWVLSGKMNSEKEGRKHLFKRKVLLNLDRMDEFKK